MICYVFLFIYLLYLVYENLSLNKYIKSFKYIIHVNGTRGKSSVCRLIDSGLRQKYSVFTKTTGTSPEIIHTDKKMTIIKRLGPPNIKEQIKMLKLAYKEKAQVVVLECMAINPSYQKICRDKIVKANITVITNIREDHKKEMGGSLLSIAKTICLTIPKYGVVISGEKEFKNLIEKEAKKQNSIFIPLDIDGDEFDNIDITQNVKTALGVCAYLDINMEESLLGMKNYLKDPGSFKTQTIKYPKGKFLFYNLLAANDIMSIEILMKKNIKKDQKYILLIHNRKDRPERMEELCRFGIENINHFVEIWLSGSYYYIAKKIFEKNKIDKQKIKKYKNNMDLDKNCDIFAIGNIKDFKLRDFQ